MTGLLFFASFLPAFLLFGVQPMATKMVLPALGGTPAVWNTAMLTFQLLLLAGYAYAHWLAKLPPKRQWRIHGVLVLVSYLVLPLAVDLPADAAVVEHPIYFLLRAFLLRLGLPFFVLASTAPLLQAWVSRSSHKFATTPYRLYSASNLGSLLGLLGYVLLVEPQLTLSQQGLIWSLLYAAVSGGLLVVGRQLHPKPAAARKVRKPISSRQLLLWVWLAFLPSSLMLGVTSYITTDIASVPLLWVIPLALYLLAFVDAFRTHPVFANTSITVAPLIGLLGLSGYTIFVGTYFFFPIPLQLFVTAVLIWAMAGWLARLKPVKEQLTHFYLCLALGGALGGVLNAIIAPLVFPDAYEYPLSLLLASITGFLLSRRTVFALCTFGLGCAMVLMTLGWAHMKPSKSNEQFSERNFFGVEKVVDLPRKKQRILLHNTTGHGVQTLGEPTSMHPAPYYDWLHEAFDKIPAAHHHPVAALGLGAGTVQCLARPDQQVDYFEINPIVVKVALNPAYFTYLRDCPGKHTITLGDARMMLARQPDQRYGIIIADVYSSGFIPTHLLTREALATYLDKLAPGGVVMMQITNEFMDLRPLLAVQTDAMHVVGYAKYYAISAGERHYVGWWVLLARSEVDAAPLVRGDAAWNELRSYSRARAWTDDYVNLLPYFVPLSSLRFMIFRAFHE